MTDRQALLRTIRASPGDDAPRLVYADWLDENGDPGLADFIRQLLREPAGDYEVNEMTDSFGPNRVAYIVRPATGYPCGPAAAVLRRIPLEFLPGQLLRTMTVERVAGPWQLDPRQPNSRAPYSIARVVVEYETR